MLWPSTVLLSSFVYHLCMDAYNPTGTGELSVSCFIAHVDAFLQFFHLQKKSFRFLQRSNESVAIAFCLWIFGFVSACYACSFNCWCCLQSNWRIKAYHKFACDIEMLESKYPFVFWVSFIKKQNKNDQDRKRTLLPDFKFECDLAANSISRVLCVSFISSNLSVIAGTNVPRIIKVNSKTLWIIHVDLG